jgi:hypothetical protein
LNIFFFGGFTPSATLNAEEDSPSEIVICAIKISLKFRSIFVSFKMITRNFIIMGYVHGSIEGLFIYKNTFYAIRRLENRSLHIQVWFRPFKVNLYLDDKTLIPM